MKTRTKSPTRAALSGLILGACLSLGLGVATAASAALPTVQDFFKPASLVQPVLSPSGKYLAVLSYNERGNRRLVIIDTSDIHKMNVAANFGDGDIQGINWVNDDRLVFWLASEHDSAFLYKGTGLFAVDRTGENLNALISRNWSQDDTASRIKSRILMPNYSFERTLRDGTDDIVIVKGTFVKDELEAEIPLRFNTRSLSIQAIIPGRAPDFAVEWAIDDHAKPLAAIAVEADHMRVILESPTGWSSVNEFDRFGVGKGRLGFNQVGADGEVYVEAGDGNADQTSSLYRMDRTTGKAAKEPLVSLKGFDFDGNLVEDLKTHETLGVHYVNDAPGSVWFDPDIRKLQEEIDAKLPGLVNTIQLAECGCSSRVVVTAMSDHQPSAYFLYDRESKALMSLGGERPWIAASKMADTDFARFKARDGLEIPVYVTKPAGKGPFPTVVLVHGGPNVRGRTWGFDSEVQFLASRGYLVVEPEFRGSAGYGAALTRAGFKQWGLKMDDDLVDAAHWAAANGWSDSKRTCVMGGSYGGYATLMALIKDPDVFRCGVAESAVTDIQLMYDIQWSDAGDDWKGYGMPEMVGDPVKDAAQFAATSPLKLAAQLKQPLLLEHGGIDRRVPIEHAEKLRSALLSSGKTNLEWVRYDEEGHGIWKPENSYDWYSRVEKFLDAQIGPGSVGK